MNKGNEKSNFKSFFSMLYARSIIAFVFIVLIAGIFNISRFFDLFVPKKSLTVYTFTEMISPEVAQMFEEKTGISVHLKYFQTNEELLAKLKINKGVGYDIIVASDYTIESLIKENILRKLNHSKLLNMASLDNRLMNHFFDPDNQYSLPYVWYVYGLAFNKNLFTDRVVFDQLGLDLIFTDPQEFYESGIITSPYRICMLDDPKEAILMASIFLFGKTEDISKDDFEKIERLLIYQKSWIEAYSNSSVQYFLFTGVAPLVFTSSHLMKKILKNSSQFDFRIPQEGSLLVIENLAISAGCENADMAHQFIDFLISQKCAELNSNKYGFNPANKAAYAQTNPLFLNNPNFFPDDSIFAKLHLTRQQYLPREVVEDIWLAVKFA